MTIKELRKEVEKAIICNSNFLLEIKEESTKNRQVAELYKQYEDRKDIFEALLLAIKGDTVLLKCYNSNCF